MNRFVFCIVTLVVTTTNGQKAFTCPKPDGQFEHPTQCDKFYLCDDGVATEKLCPDGLVFDPQNRNINKCDQPFNVDCGDRIELQEPKSVNPVCPRLNGFFADPDPSVCNIYYNCINGEPTKMRCTVGLYFDEYSGNCVWPASAGRSGCVDEKKKLSDGFTCPKETIKEDRSGNAVAHPQYPHLTDCQKFYVCLNGQEPRDLSCQIGEVYNEESGKCDSPENVPGCEDWYKDTPVNEKKNNNNN